MHVSAHWHPGVVVIWICMVVDSRVCADAGVPFSTLTLVAFPLAKAGTPTLDPNFHIPVRTRKAMI